MSEYPADIEAMMETSIQAALTQLYAMGAETTRFIHLDQIYDMETALRSYRDDLISAFNESVKFDATLDLTDNQKSYVLVNLYDLGVLNNTIAPDCSTPRSANYRAMHRTPRTFIRISKVMDIIYNAVMTLKNLEYKSVIR